MNRHARLVWACLAILIALLAGAGLGVLRNPAAHAAGIAVNTTTDELNSDGDCSLREAIQAANTDSPVDACAAGLGADVITLPAGTYALTIAGAGEDANATGDLDITTDVTINGASAPTTIIDGGDIDRVLHILSGTVAISGVTIRNGMVATTGGGILNLGVLTLNNSAIADNQAFSGGGGIDNTGTFILNSSTVSGNIIYSGGGGIQNHGPSAIATANQSTISLNQAYSGGSGIDASASMTLIYSTVSSNTGVTASGVSGTFIIKGTIIGNNTASSGPLDCFALLTSQGYNLVENLTYCFISGDTSGNITGTDPRLVGLANNGGPTQTDALLGSSPAIDAGSPDCPPPNVDQRGFPRPLDGNGDSIVKCDMGAYEISAPVATATATNTLTPLPATATAAQVNSPTPTRTPRPALGGVAAYPDLPSSGLGLGLLIGIAAAAATGALTVGGAARLAWRRRSR